MEEFESRATSVLASVPEWIWDGETPPVPVEDIADSHFGLLVCDKEAEEMAAAPGCPQLASGQSISGLLLPSRGEIWVNRAEGEEWPGRRRFTICHELGHWVLHSTGQQALFCRHGQVTEEEVPETRPPLEPKEQEANSFAAELLIPARLLREQYEDKTRDFDKLCAIFGTSARAMSKRLHAVI